MPGYVPNHEKKRGGLAKHEAELRRLLARAAPQQQLIEAAQLIIAARARVIRSRRATFSPAGATRAWFEYLDHKIQAQLAASPDAILLEFGCCMLAARDPGPGGWR